jgi:drug/metabolite transporter (DMT)-like permease
VARYLPLSNPLKATLLMLGAMVFFSSMSIFIRLASEEMHAFEIVFFRNFLALVMMMPWLIRGGLGVMRTKRVKLYGLRAVINIVGMTAGFTAITMIPLAEATALSFTAPLFATIGAALVLGEVLRLRRLTALAIGFAGTLIILRPGVEAISPGAGLALLSALTIAVTVLIIKVLTRTEQPATIVTYMALFQTPLSLVLALTVWETPSAMAFLWMFLLAGAGTIGHLLFTRAHALAEVTQLQPLDFVRLPIVAVVAFFLFAEAPTIWTWIGGSIIFASTAYITHREAKLAREKQAA